MSVLPPLLKVQDLSLERGGRILFKNLSFDLNPGEVLELRGPNGAGKSSLLRLLAGLDEPLAGKISSAASKVYVGHLDAMKPALTVRENLEFWASMCAEGGRLEPALDAFGLRPLADDRAGLLSQGQKRRLALSRLALAPRTLWLLDEPTVGLDEGSLAFLNRIIGQHRSNAGAVIAATHVTLDTPSHRILTLGSM